MGTAAIIKIKELESEHLGVENQIDLVKESGARLSQIVDTQNNIEISTQIDTAIVEYNNVCRNLVDANTRYSSSILLWQKFQSLSTQVRETIRKADHQIRIIEGK